MAHNTIKILFWLYKGRENKQGEAPLMLRVTYLKERKQISTGLFIKPSKWDADKGKAKGKDAETNNINTYINTVIGKLTAIYNDMVSQSDIDLDKLFDTFLGRDRQEMSLMELVQYHNEQVKAKLGGDYSFSTYQKYLITEKKVASFLKGKYNKKDLRLRDVQKSFIAEFDFYLKTVDKNEQNTVAKYCKNLKRIMNVGVMNGWLEKSPFDQYKSPYKKTQKIYLSKEELEFIQQKEFKLPRLQLVKDLFIFQCYTALSYVDMAKLLVSDISIGIDGRKWIVTPRQKTDERSAIPLLPEALAIIEKYKGLDKEHASRPLFPVYSNQKYNSYLHEIADICGISKNLTSHVGRRTFATTVALANGVSIETVSKILGHSNIRITQEYAMVTDLKVSEEMNTARDRMSITKAG